MNFLNGRVFGERFVVGDGVELPLPAGLGLDAATVGEVRPEHLKIDDGGFPAEVVAIEPMGSSTLIIAKVGETPITIVLSARTAFKQALQYVAGSGTQHIS